LDAEVKRLCELDGGVRVYERAEPPAANVDSRGNVRIPTKANATAQDEHYRESETVYYGRGDPEMWRTEYRIVRALDKKVMGISVVYARRGGDLPSPMHESSFSCPAIDSRPSLERSVFGIRN
jgi:hypothetical protein